MAKRGWRDDAANEDSMRFFNVGTVRSNVTFEGLGRPATEGLDLSVPVVKTWRIVCEQCGLSGILCVRWRCIWSGLRGLWLHGIWALGLGSLDAFDEHG